MIFFDIFRKLFYYKCMSSNNDNWKSIIANPGVIETSFGAKYVQYSKGEKNE